MVDDCDDATASSEKEPRLAQVSEGARLRLEPRILARTVRLIRFGARDVVGVEASFAREPKGKISRN
jgi:hypothetical protein